MNASVFKVVNNDEGQHSIWPSTHVIPNGWVDSGFEGTREDCLAHVAAVWTDMRPQSLRSAMSGFSSSI